MIRVLRKLGIALGVLLAIPLAYLLAGQIGGMIPSNGDWVQAKRGVVVFVETNGIHTGIVVPVSAAGVDWRDLVKPEHLGDPRYAGTHLAFGWGERQFYLNTPTWADVSASTVARSAFGSDETLVHVDHLPPPIPDERIRTLVLSDAEYRRLSAYIRASFRLTKAGQSQPVKGYGPADSFYEGRGHYDALKTCNAWTGDALRHAGVKVGAWTPFSWSVMRWFDSDPGE
jgi:uncharacterized protein (TIGR02117 family)